MINKKLNAVTAIFSIGMFLCLERLFRNLFIWNCGYRMQTMNTILSITATLIIYIVFMYYIARDGSSFPLGVIIPFSIIYAFYFLSSFINPVSGVLSRCADSFIFALGPLLMLSLAAANENNRNRFIHLISWVYIVVAALNIAFIIWPDLYYVISEWRQLYFMGYRSVLCFPLTFGVLFSLLDSHYNGNRITLLIYLILFFVNSALVKAAGGLIGAFIVFLYLIPPVRKLFEKTDLAVFIGIIIVVFIALMWFAEPVLNLPPIKHFVQDVLHRDLTLTGRLIIWPGVREFVANKPLLGYGISENGNIFYDTVYNTGWTGLDGVWLHAHNEFLQTLYEGGIITLLAALYMLFFTAKKIRSCEDKRLSGIFKMIIFSLLLMLQDDQFVYYPWYVAAFVCHMAVLCCAENRLSE